MEDLIAAMRQMVEMSDAEAAGFAERCLPVEGKKGALLAAANTTVQGVYFIQEGILRTRLIDLEGVEHTIHFAQEGQFVTDYSNFILRQPSMYDLQCLSNVRAILLPRAAIEWGYEHIRAGERIGRLIAEYYFVYHDSRIRDTYLRTPKERYDAIETLFPRLHQRVPQAMIASYLGITPIHLSRLKKESRPNDVKSSKK